MTFVYFATQETKIAEKYIKQGNWQRLKENSDKILKAVKEGLIRIGDPSIYGEPKIITGDEWYKKRPNDDFIDFVYNYLLKMEG